MQLHCTVTIYLFEREHIKCATDYRVTRVNYIIINIINIFFLYSILWFTLLFDTRYTTVAYYNYNKMILTINLFDLN